MPIDTPLVPIAADPSHRPVTAHPDFTAFHAALAAALASAVPLEGQFFRASAPPYSTPLTFFSGAGAARGGNRWNPPGIHTVYLSATPELAMSECLAANRALGIPDHDGLPITTEAAIVKVSHCLDLRDARVAGVLKFDILSLVNEHFQSSAVRGIEARCQAFGRAAHAVGIQAIIAPSRVDPLRHNVVVFRSLLSGADLCEALHPHLLSADP